MNILELWPWAVLLVLAVPAFYLLGPVVIGLLMIPLTVAVIDKLFNL